MSLFQRPIRPPAIWSDQAVERYVAALGEDISLDPLFRRRLRGSVVNRFVAEREQARRPGARPAGKRMGTLGRSVLYASVVLATSVTGTMAASQGAVPGDALYPLKRQIESLRLEALPAHFQDDLAAHALGERIEELARLAERGDWARVAAHAAVVAHGSDVFLARMDLETASADRYLVVLNGLLDRLPARAQLAIAAVVRDVASATVDAGEGKSATTSGRVPASGEGAGSDGENGDRQGGDRGASGGASAPPGPTGTPSTAPSPRPTPRHEPQPTDRPEPTAKASAKVKPSPTPRATTDDDSD
jgi:hypothetical protein